MFMRKHVLFSSPYLSRERAVGPRVEGGGHRDPSPAHQTKPCSPQVWNTHSIQYINTSDAEVIFVLSTKMQNKYENHPNQAMWVFIRKLSSSTVR